MSGPPAFAADAMLGALARWLRLLGYDCTYSRDVTDDELVEAARIEGRTVLTRDRRVAKRAPRAVFVPPGSLDDELTTVARALHLDIPDAPPAIRCSVCNGLLERAPPGSGGGAVPARVVELGLDIWRCAGCSRTYWHGTHVDSMSARLRGIRARLGAAPGAEAVDRAGQNG